jgi:pimeloyl-ACP methyl ester carboxylesterase
MSWKPAACVIAFCLAGAAVAAPSGRQDDVVFTRTTPFADFAEIERRTRPPVFASKVVAHGQALDVSKEHFVVYVPARKPPEGYALLVFVPPWDDARLPPDWVPILDEKGVIFASAWHSSNDSDIRARREPLALLAAANLIQEYDVDPSRVFVGGFSGGGHIAMRLALAYPDLFRGALLNSGSDRIGSTQVPIPPADLFRKFQEDSKLFYVVGDGDTELLSGQNSSVQSMRTWCVSHVDHEVMPNMGHDVATAHAFEKGLTVLLGPAGSAPDLSSCRAGLAARRDEKLQIVEDLLAKGDRAGARRALDDVDAEFGGLAAPRSLELDAKIH